MSKLTQRNFEQIAFTLRWFNEVGGLMKPQYEVLCDHFAEMLQETNEKFDRQRFLEACGLEVREKCPFCGRLADPDGRCKCTNKDAN